jgi:hypothetical protein
MFRATGGNGKHSPAMAHLFLNRARLFHPTRGPGVHEAHFRWETFNAVLYNLGTVLFVLGSVSLFPRLAPYAGLGGWIFLCGSMLYLVVNAHDTVEVVRARRAGMAATLQADLELVAALTYLGGTCLFVAGRVALFAGPAWATLGALGFVIGSLLFVVGACINVLQIVQARSLAALQLMNLTAVAFVVGSVLFAVGSVPYLWHLEAERDRALLDGFLAWQWLAGSALFLVGGLFNFWRAALVSREEMAACGNGRAADLPARPLPARAGS